MAQIWRVEALAHEVGAARAEFFPNLNLAGLLGLSSTIYHLLFNPSSYENFLTPTISLPVYTAGDIQAHLDAKRAEFQSAVFTYNNMILKSTEEVVDTLVFARTVYAKKVQQELIVCQAAKRLSLSEDRLKNGLDNALDTLEQREILLLKELDDMDLAYGRYAAAIALIKAVGEGTWNHEKAFVLLLVYLRGALCPRISLLVDRLKNIAWTDDAYVEGNQVYLTPASFWLCHGNPHR